MRPVWLKNRLRCIRFLSLTIRERGWGLRLLQTEIGNRYDQRDHDIGSLVKHLNRAPLLQKTTVYVEITPRFSQQTFLNPLAMKDEKEFGKRLLRPLQNLNRVEVELKFAEYNFGTPPVPLEEINNCELAELVKEIERQSKSIRGQTTLDKFYKTKKNTGLSL